MAGGFRNENLLLQTRAGWSFVLRRYRHDNRCAVEAALLELLAGRVPVPEVVAADPEGTVCGEPVLITSYLDGVALTSAFADQDDPGCVGLADQLGAALAAVHAIGFDESGVFHDESLTPTPMPAEMASLPQFVAGQVESGALNRRLSQREQRALMALAQRQSPLIENTMQARGLVHSDFNPKNIIVRPTRRSGGWQLVAVIDWVFAFSGCGLADFGNLLRFVDELPAGLVDRLPSAYRQAGGRLDHEWRETAAALDLFALTDLAARTGHSAVAERAVEALRAQIAS